MQHPIVDGSGQQKGALEIPEQLVDAAHRPHLWWLVSKAQDANRRAGTASTKTKSEVRGGGAKPWRQKGTGRARQGSIRAPQWRGGGVVHGPKPRSYRKRVPRRERRMAFYSLIIEQLRRGKVTIVDSLQVPEGKTQEVVGLLGALSGAAKGRNSGSGQPKTLVVLDHPEEKMVRGARNLAYVRVRQLQGTLLSDLTWAERLMLTAAAAEQALKEAERWLVRPSES